MTATAITAHPTTSPGTPAAEEFDRQSQTLVDAGYPALAGLDEAGFRAMLEPLRRPSRAAASSAPIRIPFAIVVSSALVSADRALPALRWKTTTGWTELTADELATFRPTEGVSLPEAPVYLVTDIDTGQENLGVRARDALPAILREGRTPLTIDEGVSLLAVFPASSGSATPSSCPAPAAATSGSPRSGSAKAIRGSAGAGRATRTPGWARRRPPDGSPCSQTFPAQQDVRRPARPARNAPLSGPTAWSPSPTERLTA